MSFYERFVQLCKLKGVAPSRAATDCGINRSNVTNWKNNGFTPRSDALQKIADYLGVSTDYLLYGGFRSTFTSYANGITAYSGNSTQEIEEMLAERKPGTFRIVFRGVGTIVTVDNDSNATDDQINSVIAIYDHDHEHHKKAPTVSGERDILDDVDLAFYGEYKELSEDDKETVRDMVRLMRERRKNKE